MEMKANWRQHVLSGSMVCAALLWSVIPAGATTYDLVVQADLDEATLYQDNGQVLSLVTTLSAPVAHLQAGDIINLQ